MASFYAGTITSVNPAVVSTVNYYYARSGQSMHYWGNVEMHTTNSGGWRNNRWAVSVYVAGQCIGWNITVKPVTSGIIGTTSYYGSFDGWVGVGSTTGGNLWMSVSYLDTGYSYGWTTYTNWGSRGANVPISPIPITYVSLWGTDINRLILNWWCGGMQAERVHIYNGGTFLGEFWSSPANVTGLQPNTVYGDLKAYGYGNGMFGPVGNSISLKTYPSTVSVASISVSDITPFTCRVICSSSDSATTNLAEYSMLDANGTVILGPYNSSQYTFDFSELLPETNYIIRVRLRTSESNLWSEYKTLAFRTLTDQVQGWIKLDNNWSRGKVYVKKDDSWQVVKHAYKKLDNSWKETTND